MCGAMHEVKRSFKQKPQKFLKTPKSRSKCMKDMNNERKRDHTK